MRIYVHMCLRIDGWVCHCICVYVHIYGVHAHMRVKFHMQNYIKNFKQIFFAQLYVRITCQQLQALTMWLTAFNIGF